MTTPNPADAISDAELEAMVEAAVGPEVWAFHKEAVKSKDPSFSDWLECEVAAMRRAWFARPETARALDEAAISGKSAIYAHTALYQRGRHLIAHTTPEEDHG